MNEVNEWWRNEGMFSDLKNEITEIIPYWKNLPMLKVHLDNWAKYPPEILDRWKIIIVDDHSPKEHRPDALILQSPVKNRIALYRNKQNIPWNMLGCRNLAAREAQTLWLMMHDMDHLILWYDAWLLLTMELDPQKSYRPVMVRHDSHLQWFDRLRWNQFLVSKENFWKAGGYDEDYAGMRGADMIFLRCLKKYAPVQTLHGVRYVRYTNETLPGSETYDADRDRREAKRRGKELMAKKGREVQGENPVRFKWERVL